MTALLILGAAAAAGAWVRDDGRASEPARPDAGTNAPEPAVQEILSRGGTFRTPRDAPSRAREFYFTRAMFSDWGFRRRGAWATDYPEADQHFLVVLRRLTRVDAGTEENAVRLDDPELRRFPFLYAVEVGWMQLTDAEVRGLRSYLQSGGFLLVDDFWGTREWAAFEEQIRRVLPGLPIVDLPLSHPVFSAFYDIDEIVQVPNVQNGMRGGPTHERDGYVPRVRSIFDEEGRLLVLISWNSDLGDAWEWADKPSYPLEYSTFAFELGVNAILYAMSH